MPPRKRPRTSSDTTESRWVLQTFRHCPGPPVETLESEDNKAAFLKWWKDEVLGRQSSFVQAFELRDAETSPPFLSAWSNIRARRDEAARTMSIAGSLVMAPLWNALKFADENRTISREAFNILSCWYGGHFPQSTAFLPQTLAIRNWPSAQADPPGPCEVEELANQWAAQFGRGTLDPARKCASALGLIDVGDATCVYGVDPRDQLVTVVTYGSPSEDDLYRIFGGAIEQIEPNENRRVYWKAKAVALPQNLATSDSSFLLALTLLRTCADRDPLDDGRNLLPRHQDDIQHHERTPFDLTESGDWDSLNRGLWLLQTVTDLVGVAEAYVKVAQHIIPGFMERVCN